MHSADGAPLVRLVSLQVNGMTCGACSSTVERALCSTDGVYEANVSCVTNLAHVKFDSSRTSVQSLLEAIEDVGFDTVEDFNVSTEKQMSHQHGQSEFGQKCVELDVNGMTCSACSGTVERHLRGLEGVSHASVSLILNKAFVTYDSEKWSASALQSEVEDVGFDAEVVIITEPEKQVGRASIHVSISCCSQSLNKGSFELCCNGIHGVLGVQTIATGHKRITYDPYVVGARELLAQVKSKARTDFEVEWASVSTAYEQLHGHLREMGSLRHDLMRAAPIAAFVFFIAILLPGVTAHAGHGHLGFLSWQIYHGIDVLTISVFILATPCQFWIGRRFHFAAYGALKRKSPNMDVLVSVATSVSYVYSASLVVFCLVMPPSPSSHSIVQALVHFLTMGPILIAVVLFGKFLEARAKLKAMHAMTDLSSSNTASTTVCSSAGESDEPVELVEVGDVLRILAGAKIPVDGIVCSEAIVHVDESLLTGESTAVLKRNGDLVIGGTTCVSGGCFMRVTKVGSDTTLGQMYQLVQDAQASKANIQRTADKIARVFVPSVICLAFATFVVWSLLIFGGVVEVPTGAMNHGIRGSDSLKLLFAMKFGMAVLMIACPCAMGLATPMAVMVATNVAAKRGCLVKSASALETTANLDTVVLDKTGTITEGSPAIVAAACVTESFDYISEAWASLSRAHSTDACVMPEDQKADSARHVPVHFMGDESSGDVDQVACLWWLLAVLESSSDHPLAKTIRATAATMQGLPPVTAPNNFEEISGRGVRCRVDQLGGITARVGNMRFYEESAADTLETAAMAKLRVWVQSMQHQGNTVVVLHVDGLPLGALALQDPIRAEASRVIEHLQKTLGVEVWLCTGDNTATAQSIAHQVGIHNVVAEALPADKSECVKQLQLRGRRRRVCFVGDGINDAPALAQADVGVAIGVGAQVAVEAADVALVRSELQDFVSFLSLSKATFRTIALNFFWAFCFNFVCLPMAAGVFYPSVHIPPLVAGIGMASSSCLVIFSSLTLRHFKSKALMPDRSTAPSKWPRPSIYGLRQWQKMPQDDLETGSNSSVDEVATLQSLKD